MQLHNIIVFIFINLVSFLVKGDVELTAPVSGNTFTVSGSAVTFDIIYADDGSSPDVSEAISLTYTLCTGPNDDINGFSILAKVSPGELTNNKYSANVLASVGASGSYYVQIYANYKSGSTIHYTERFTLEGMTGTAVIPSGSGDPPSAQFDLDQQLNSASFSVTYTLQTGRTRYAPMQTQPNTQVTATAWSRRFPTSSVTYYTTIMPSPNVYSTITPGWSYTMSSLHNYATPAPFPSELSWYAASERLQSASLDSSFRKMKKKRWDD